ncbi:MAG: hypothetical protein JHC67_09920, partial [Mycolicibacterium sp.]|nr:hypothetical protein [Mycolicibacterium sp.]
MSGPNPPDREPGGQPTEEYREELTDTGFSRAYSAPESEQYTITPYLPAELELYAYASYDPAGTPADLSPPRWPWVVGVTAIIAAISLVVSVSLLVTRTDTTDLASPTTTAAAPPVQDEITTTAPPPPPPPSEVPPPE